MAVSQPHTSEDPSITALWKLRFVLACGVPPPPCLVPCGCKTGKMCQPSGRPQMSGKDGAARGEQVAPSQHTAWPPCAPSTGCQQRVDTMCGCSPVVGKGRTGHTAHPPGVSHLPDFLQFDPFVEYTQTQYHPYNTFGKMSKSMSPFPGGLHPSL